VAAGFHTVAGHRVSHAGEGYTAGCYTFGHAWKLLGKIFVRLMLYCLEFNIGKRGDIRRPIKVLNYFSKRTDVLIIVAIVRGSGMKP